MHADLILKNALVFQTFEQCFLKMDLAITGERFQTLSPVFPSADWTADRVVDCTGKYIVPGLIDIHMHVESSMTYPYAFSRWALSHGTTTVVSDPHEIANVFGLAGIEAFLEQTPVLDIFYGIPSCVPSTDASMETSGGAITEVEVETLLDNEKIVCLGEVMNFQALVSQEETLLRRIIALCRRRRPSLRLEGHCPAITGEDLSAFIAAGVDADHTQQTPESVVEKSRKGMFLELQAKSLTREVIAAMNDHHLWENAALVTDDVMPDKLLKGHLNENIKLAAANGMAMEQAIYCATWTPARRMGFTDRGIIAPGRLADFLILSDLDTFAIEAVYKRGRPYTGEEPSAEHFRFPETFYHSIHCREAVAEDFVLRVPDHLTEVQANVMGCKTFGNATEHRVRTLPVRDGVVDWQGAGLNLVTVYERYGKTGGIAHALTEPGFTAPGAVATSWSHDSHNLLVSGNCVEDMIAAQREVVRRQGAYVCVRGGQVTAAGLPVGGILSDGPIEDLARELGAVRRAMEALGYDNNNVIMNLSTQSLLVSPELKVSERGLFLVKTQTRLPLLFWQDGEEGGIL